MFATWHVAPGGGQVLHCRCCSSTGGRPVQGKGRPRPESRCCHPASRAGRGAGGACTVAGRGAGVGSGGDVCQFWERGAEAARHPARRTGRQASFPSQLVVAESVGLRQKAVVRSPGASRWVAGRFSSSPPVLYWSCFGPGVGETSASFGEGRQDEDNSFAPLVEDVRHVRGKRGLHQETCARHPTRLAGWRAGPPLLERSWAGP